MNAQEILFSKKIAIVGCGCSGVMALAQLVRCAKTPMEIHVFDPAPEFAVGLAYRTPRAEHLLNVRADRMGAYAEDHQDFWKWLETSVSRNKYCADDFVPRRLYGDYLKHVNQTSLSHAKDKNINIRFIQAEVNDVDVLNSDQQLVLHYKQDGVDQSVAVDTLIVATGNSYPDHFGFENGISIKHEYLPGVIWCSGEAEEMRLQKFINKPSTESVLIVGTGLTMIDMALDLVARGHSGKITAISRHGLLPATHKKIAPHTDWSWTQDVTRIPDSAEALEMNLRSEVALAKKAGHNWRALIDALRPMTTQIWQRLSETEKAKFIADKFTQWNVLRHRMAPQIRERLQQLQSSGQLDVHAVARRDVISDGSQFVVECGDSRFAADVLIDCTGPDYRLQHTKNKLLQNLHQKNLAQPGALGWGVAVDEHCRIKNSRRLAIFAMGPLMIGDRLECTAVPELRVQAKTIAESILN